MLQRKVLPPNDASSLDDIRRRLNDLEDRFNGLATPFDWRHTRADLAKLMRRLAHPVSLAA